MFTITYRNPSIKATYNGLCEYSYDKYLEYYIHLCNLFFKWRQCLTDQHHILQRIKFIDSLIHAAWLTTK